MRDTANGQLAGPPGGHGCSDPQYVAEGGPGTVVDAVRAACPDDLARQEAAVDLDNRIRTASQILLGDDLTATASLSCGSGMASLTFTNPTELPVGMIVGSHPDTDSDDGAPQDHVAVEWLVAPGATAEPELPADTSNGRCELRVLSFIAEPSTVDAAIPGTDGPATTGDDPAQWLPALVGIDGVAGRATGTWKIFDIRYTHVDAEAAPGRKADAHPGLGAAVCPGTIEQPDPDHIAFAFRVDFRPATVDLGNGPEEHPAYSTLYYETFRRGGDGRWRMLTGGIKLSGLGTAADCGPIVPHP